jgi:hypothetical protein
MVDTFDAGGESIFEDWRLAAHKSSKLGYFVG